MKKLLTILAFSLLAVSCSKTTHYGGKPKIQTAADNPGPGPQPEVWKSEIQIAKEKCEKLGGVFLSGTFSDNCAFPPK